VEQQTLDIQHKIAVMWIFMADKRRRIVAPAKSGAQPPRAGADRFTPNG
jgi:hypothetical protein